MGRVRYGFKASAIRAEQIEDRFLRHKENLFPDDFFCELYLDGLDIKDSKIKKRIIDNASRFEGTYSLHVPVINEKNNFYDSQNIDMDYIGHLADISDKLNKAAIILHRSWGISAGIGWDKAIRSFRDWIYQISRDFSPFLFLVENFGIVFRYLEKGIQFYKGSLDHFFPQEIDDFNMWLKKNEITNVHPFVDIAHANITLNLLKAWGQNRERATQYINDSLHEKIANGTFFISKIEDYILPSVYPYFHMSDSQSLHADTAQNAWQDYFVSEGLVIGSGDVKWRPLLKRILEIHEDPIFIMETNMADPKEAIEQEKSLIFTRELIQDIHKEIEV